MKSCYECQKTLPEEEFYEDAYSNDGYTTSCRACQRKRSQEYYKKTKDHLTDKQKESRRAAYLRWKEKNPEGYKKGMKKHNAKRVAKRRRHPDVQETNQESN